MKTAPALTARYTLHAQTALGLARQIVAALEDKQTPPDQNPDCPLDWGDVGTIEDIAGRLETVLFSIRESSI